MGAAHAAADAAADAAAGAARQLKALAGLFGVAGAACERGAAAAASARERQVRSRAAALALGAWLEQASAEWACRNEACEQQGSWHGHEQLLASPWGASSHSRGCKGTWVSCWDRALWLLLGERHAHRAVCIRQLLAWPRLSSSGGCLQLWWPIDPLSSHHVCASMAVRSFLLQWWHVAWTKSLATPLAF